VHYRTLGGTGIIVSELALEAMMFGAMGNPDHDESVRMIHRAHDAGINLRARRTSTRANTPTRAVRAAGRTLACLVPPVQWSARYVQGGNEGGDLALAGFG
jgi:hypothetical protein